ncbi:class F sortase [Halobacillus sp. A5]|uniref:class F sortase n=1 Tax=Halobacillus sp. A5 TaxID=2880263 RepID=UPI0020A64DD6|nr:class F sortase [Halobacillus sp. A5]MCP3028860.1 class F sortase [Halobacillus sp. A5]
MKPFIGSLILGFLVFFVSFQWLQDKPSEGARVISTSDFEETTKAEKDNIPREVEKNTTLNDDESSYKGITPVKIEIPAINVSAPVTQEGLTEEGGMDVPDNDKDVGWFEPGTKPGDAGNAVLAGHVDSYKGPAVFFDLEKLKTGDDIRIHGDHTLLTFEVERVVAYPADEAPVRKIFGSSDTPSLNVITCTGWYDQEAETHQDRLVVYTKLTGQKGA